MQCPVYDSITEACGSTPLLRLKKVEEELGLDCEVFMKCESLNPLNSVKDRVARGMIQRAIEDGRLTPGTGQTLVESSSGNLAIALAQQCAIHGFTMICVVDTTALAKVAAAEIFGAQLEIVEPKPEWTTKEIKAARRSRVQEVLQKIPGAVHLDQYGSSDNERVHWETTGPEVFEQVDGELDVFVGAVSTGGTLTGAGGYLKERLPNLRLVGVEPVGSLIFTDANSHVNYLNAGSGLDFPCSRVERCLAQGLIDETYQVADDVALTACAYLARTAGVLVGPSTGQSFCGLLRTLQRGGAKRAVFMNADSGRPYTQYILTHQKEQLEQTKEGIQRALLSSLSGRARHGA